VIVTVWPPIMIAPVRFEVPVLAAMVYVAVPDPVPVLVEEIQGALAADSHLQPAPVVTVSDPLPPVAPTFTVIGDTV
jgi:hypothetical protein